jgi:hypothetical protein
MVDFIKSKGSNIKLNTSAFSGGSGLLDSSTDDVQKAFEAINVGLDLANSTFDGIMSSADKIKLDSLAALESGVTIKSINGQSIVGPGNLTVSGSGGDLMLIQEAQPTASVGQNIFWIKPESGSFGLYIVTGE